MVELYDCMMRSDSDNSNMESSFGSETGYDSFYFQNQATEVAHLMINQTPKQTREQEELASTLLKLGPIGLSLDISSSLASFIEKNLINPNTYHPIHRAINAAKLKDFERQQAEKLKASSFAATSLRIGTWQRESMNESDLTAKCYFAKRRLVWEVLEGGLKKKIELQWSDIVGIQGVIKENEPGQLKIELSNPPTFYQEINTSPRKHTNWQPTTDFTGGQASICRRHYIWFSPGILDSRFEKLIQTDDRLLRLSQQQFPSQPSSPYFQTYESNSISFGGQYPGFTLTNFLHSPQLRNPDQTILQQSSVQKDYSSPNSVMNFPNIDVRSNNDVVNNSPLPPFWSQMTNHFAESSVRGHQSEFAENSVRDYGVINSPNYNILPNYDEMVTTTFNSTDQVLSDIEKFLFEDLQGGENYVQRVTSFGSLINTSFQENSQLAYENQQAASSRVAPQRFNFDPATMYTPIYNIDLPLFHDPPPEDFDRNRNDVNFRWVP